MSPLRVPPGYQVLRQLSVRDQFGILELTVRHLPPRFTTAQIVEALDERQVATTTCWVNGMLRRMTAQVRERARTHSKIKGRFNYNWEKVS